jgi:tRNA-(ms[2]io[6]A)-hydroxylase
VQVAALLARRGWAPRADTPNHYARQLLAQVRGREPERLLDALLVAAFIESRSHERLALLAVGFARAGEAELAVFYQVLATAEERHAEIFVELAAPLVPAGVMNARLSELAEVEAAIVGALPHAPRVH